MPQELFLEFKNNTLLPFLFGEHNTHLSHLEKTLNVSIADRGNTLRIAGEDSALRQVESVLNTLYKKLEKKDMTDISIADIDAQLRFTGSEGNGQTAEDERRSALAIRTKKKTIAPRTHNQAAYIEMIRNKDMVFGLGPAGTGKTYLAVAAGVDMFLQGRVERLVFCRPAVEAGENLGFLPGDMKEKIDPYLRPVYDALHDMLPFDFLIKRMEAGDIEIAPLAFMRGRTLSNAFVILDEAQNASSMQIKMFLTRMGESSRMVITGDPRQSDLPGHVKSGLNEATDILADIDEIGFIRFDRKDVVRHALVAKVLKAYENE
ncbi:MAG: PhoH family protein [Alphaproteobacteria bacterium]|nr:PhoH family protein [Alphaproteobacteria bacterium]MCB9974879.1 PhoH family protein [Rhodospirillales bacterium]